MRRLAEQFGVALSAGLVVLLVTQFAFDLPWWGRLAAILVVIAATLGAFRVWVKPNDDAATPPQATTRVGSDSKSTKGITVDGVAIDPSVATGTIEAGTRLEAGDDIRISNIQIGKQEPKSSG